MLEDEDFSFCPPPGPPPLLSEEQLVHLAQQGWLSLPLPAGVSDAIAEVLVATAEFFKDVSLDKPKLFPSKQGTEFGYYLIPDEKEYVTFRCHVHGSSNADATSTTALAANIESSAENAWRESGALLFRILCDISRASDLGISVWDDILDGTLTLPETEAQMTHSLMRLFRYFPEMGRAEEHTDLGLLTLCIGDSAGLQVLDRTKSSDDAPVWITAAPGCHTAMILVGQTLRVLSSDTLNAGVHRVTENADGRHSMVFALRHSSRHDVDFSLFGGEGHVPPAEFWKTIKVGKVNINTAKETRAAQRALLRAKMSAGADKREVQHGQG